METKDCQVCGPKTQKQTPPTFLPQSFSSLRIFRPCIEICFSQFNLKCMCILETNAPGRFSKHVKGSENNYRK